MRRRHQDAVNPDLQRTATPPSDRLRLLPVRARQTLDQATALRKVSSEVQEMLGQNKAQEYLAARRRGH